MAPPDERPATLRSGRPAREEGELLLAALRAWREPAAAELVSRFDDADWQTVMRHAQWHNVLPLLHHRVQSLASRPPSPVFGRLHDAQRLAAARNLRILAQLGELLSAFSAANLPVIALKGAALQQIVYDHVALRGMRDIDVLVHVEHVERVERLLLDLGYGPTDRPGAAEEMAHFHHLRPFLREGSVKVEVHWTLELPTSPFRIDLESLWARAPHTRLAGLPAQVLSPVDLLLHLCLHLSYHHHFRVRLRHLADVALTMERFAPSLSWPELVERARAWGVERFVYATLSLSGQLLGSPAPPDAMASLAHDVGDDELVAVAGDFLMAAPLQLPITYREARASRGIGAKARVYLDSLFPPRDRLRAMYGVPPGSWRLPLYYFVRPLHVARRFGRVLAQLGRQRTRLPLTLERESNGALIDWWVAGKEERCR